MVFGWSLHTLDRKSTLCIVSLGGREGGREGGRDEGYTICKSICRKRREGGETRREGGRKRRTCV